MAEENKTEDKQAEASAAMLKEMASEGAGTLTPEGGLALPDGGTLSQEEIDSLLGFGDKGPDIPSKGVDAILYRSKDNYEKFPMMEVVFDRFARSISTALRSFTGENSEITIENIISLRFEDYVNSIPLPSMLSIFQAVEWENLGLMAIDNSLIYSLVDILLGGGKSEGVFRVEGRPFTTIEQDILRNFSRLVFEEMTLAFTPITTVTFRMDRMETNPRFAGITRPSSPVVIISCRIEFDNVGGKIDIVFPYTTLEPVKDLLTQMFSGETFGSDVSWEPFLSDELKVTNVKLKAQLDHKVVSLKELALLKVGTTIVMENRPTDDIEITCNGIGVCKGKLGSYGENIAISVTDVKILKDII